MKKHLLTCKKNPNPNPFPENPEREIKKRRRYNTMKKEPLTCEHCGKQFKEIKFLESHQWVHTGWSAHSYGNLGRKFGIGIFYFYSFKDE